MKKIIYTLTASLLLFACGGGAEETTETTTNTDTDTTLEAETPEEDLLAMNDVDPRTYGGEKDANQAFIDEIYPVADQAENNLLGSYVGEFGRNLINVTLFKAKDGKAEGYSVCAGNFRKIEGTFEQVGDDEYSFDMDEPGDDQYDGNFQFTLNASDETLIGEWTPFKKEGNSPKSYKLEKRIYRYDPGVGTYPEASERLLTENDVMYRSEDELSEMRNEIYARHGYSFKNKDWRYYFEGMPWYMPMGIDIRDKLTDVEVENIELIYEYESYFEDYYDDYGR